MTQAVTSPPTAAPPPDLATTLHQAVLALQAIIESKPDMDRLIAELVRICAGALQAGGAGVWMTETADKPELILEHNLPALQILVEGVVARGVVTVVRRCVREGKPLVVPPFGEDRGMAGAGLESPVNPSPMQLLLVPMRLNGADAATVGMVLLLAVPEPRESDTGHIRTCLNFLARQAGAVEQALAHRHLSLVETDRGRSHKLVRFTEQVHKHLFQTPVAADIANLARDVLEAQRVAVELYPRLKKRVLAVSNVDEPNARGGIMQVQRLIFDYVRDRQVPVVIDRQAATQLVSDPALQDASAAYFLASTFEAFSAAPIKSDDPTSPVLGVILAEYAAAERAQANSALLSEIARLCTGAVQNAMDLESLPLIKPIWSLRAVWRKPTSSKKALATTVLSILLVLILLLGVIPFDFAIRADCQIRPRAQLSIVAPLQERIISVPVRAGEHVYPRSMQAALRDKVKPLAVFDSIELVTKRAEAAGQLATLQVDQNEAQNKNDMTKISSLRNQIEQVRSEMDRIDHQIEQCTVWSPIEGTVLTENVEQKQYSTPHQGEELMDVASFSDWELVVDVPESEVAAVRSALSAAMQRAYIDGTPDQGVEVEYILYPWPETRYSIQARGTATILPASQQSKSSNVFRLQVKLDPTSLPPGIAMSGVTGRAKIHIGRKPLLTQWTRGVVRMIKMTLLFEDCMARREHKEYRVAVGAEPVDRPISELRADLQVSPQLFYGQLCFVIKDPVTLRYYRLQPVEHFLVTQFDGQRTARDLLGLLQQQFADLSLSVQDVVRFVGMLHEAHLLVGQGVGHSQWLVKRRAAARRKRFLELAMNFLFFKLPLFRPDRLLKVLHQTVGKLIFTRTTGLAALGLVLVALINVLTHVERFSHMTYSLLSPQNLMILYCVFICTKVFHEFGHGLAAKHFGGEVSSMGIMLFIVTPSFYCDTSDAWMIPSRAARLWINAGGIVVELVIAALASFVWLHTPDDGLLNQVALNIMISCSVATLFFNANPLLRYDGYYFLADLLEVPNLMAKGRQFVGYVLQKYVLGLKPTAPPDAARGGWLTAYALAATVYRWVVVFGIIGLLYVFFDRYGMGPVGILLAAAYVILTVVWPLVRSMQFLWKQRWDVYKRLGYMAVAGGLGATVLIVLALMPVRNSIREPLVVLSRSDEPVYVRTPGYIEVVEHDAGDRVRAGDIILRLSDPALQSALSEMEHRRTQASLEAARAAAENKPGVLAAAQEKIAQFDQEIGFIRERMAELVLRAPVDGVIIRDTSLRRLVGNYVPMGLKLCRVIETQKLEARISLPQQKAALVKAGMPVRLRLWSDPSAEIHTVVGRVSSELSDQLLHPALASTSHGDVDVKPDDSHGGGAGPAAVGGMKSTVRRSTVIIELPRPPLTSPATKPEFLADGMTGRGEIEFPRTTLIARLWRLLLDSTTPDWHL